MVPRHSNRFRDHFPGEKPPDFEWIGFRRAARANRASSWEKLSAAAQRHQ
jgi:hypothetical protein